MPKTEKLFQRFDVENSLIVYLFCPFLTFLDIVHFIRVNYVFYNAAPNYLKRANIEFCYPVCNPIPCDIVPKTSRKLIYNIAAVKNRKNPSSNITEFVQDCHYLQSVFCESNDANMLLTEIGKAAGFRVQKLIYKEMENCQITFLEYFCNLKFLLLELDHFNTFDHFISALKMIKCQQTLECFSIRFGKYFINAIQHLELYLIQFQHLKHVKIEYNCFMQREECLQFKSFQTKMWKMGVRSELVTVYHFNTKQLIEDLKNDKTDVAKQILHFTTNNIKILSTSYCWNKTYNDWINFVRSLPNVNEIVLDYPFLYWFNQTRDQTNEIRNIQKVRVFGDYFLFYFEQLQIQILPNVTHLYFNDQSCLKYQKTVLSKITSVHYNFSLAISNCLCNLKNTFPNLIELTLQYTETSSLDAERVIDILNQLINSYKNQLQSFSLICVSSAVFQFFSNVSNFQIDKTLNSNLKRFNIQRKECDQLLIEF